MALTDKLTAIANAIRAKTGGTATMTLAEMPSEIASIQTGITPSGSVTLTEEGSFNVTEKATAIVDMSATRANLAEAVTAKGVDTLPTSSFDTIATNIGLISGGGGLPVIMQREFTLATDATTTATVVATLPCDELNAFVADLPVSYTPTSLKNTKMVLVEIRRVESVSEITTSNTFYLSHCAALAYRSHADRIAFGAWKPSSIQINGVDTRRYDGVYGVYFDSPQYNTGISIKARSGSTTMLTKAGTYQLTIYDLSGSISF